MEKNSRIKTRRGPVSRAGLILKKHMAKKSGIKIIVGLGGLALITIGCLFMAFADRPEEIFLEAYYAFKDIPENLREKSKGTLSMDEDGFYEIKTASDYHAFWKKAVLDADIKGRMMNDIYLNDTDGWDRWHKEPPENVSEPVKYFAGVFDGNGHTLYGLYSDSRYGLVRMNGGSILNLTIKESLVTGEFSNGGICYYNDSLISGCNYGGEVWTPGSGKRAGICVENNGTIERCGFTGSMGNAWSRSDKAGICTKNIGTIKDCYNFAIRAKGLFGTCYGIANKGETNCFVKEGAGWDISPESQVMELSDEQVFYLADLLDGDLYSFFNSSASKPVWMRQLQNMQADIPGESLGETSFDTPISHVADSLQVLDSAQICSSENSSVNFRALREELLNEAALKAAFQDELVAFLIPRLIGQENILLSRLALTPSAGGDVGSLFQIEMTYDGGTVEITAFPSEDMDSDCRNLWQACGRILGTSEEEWEHRTYKLANGRPGEGEDWPKKLIQEGEFGKEASVMLYQTSEGREGFFYITGETVYRIELTDRENADLYEKAFGELCQGREMEACIGWTDDTLRQNVLSAAEKEYGTDARKLSSEEIMGITSLTIENVQDIRDFRDLEYLPHLTSLTLLGDGQEEGTKEVKIILSERALPVLQKLSMQNCRLAETDFLGQMAELKELYMEDCTFNGEGSAFLGKLSQLEVLEISNMDMTDISFLEDMPKLKRLSLEGNGLTDITPIASCRNLEELSLSDNGVEELSPLAGLTKLKNLDLSYNNITDISKTGSLLRLKNLNLGYNQISDISVLNELKELTWLRIDGNKALDLSPVQERDGLAIRYTIAYY
ncbi:MAG: leucine-rich repeat domain-containing protein [Lachnospiraceae bacterium]|nr:leucine-rich repeat domain-containing protein [Lachnospiraceae bacterium]